MINKGNVQNKACELLKLLQNQTLDKDLDFSECIEKLNQLINSSDSDIKIVLLGSFADGKTSTIAGLMEQVFDNMKIDSDESSDEIVVYKPKDLKNGFVVIDTPGLFGTKEREIDGRNVKFSELTEKYISEAHIVLYVTSAVAPIKESHAGILRKVLRDYDKLNSTIFVLNKMDETGVNITDETAYNSMSARKRDFVITRLKDLIGLSNEEAIRLKTICVVADPKGKGIQKWLETPDRYRQLSRLPMLHQTINSVVEHSNVNDLKSEASVAVVKDVLNRIAEIMVMFNGVFKRQSDRFREDYKDLQEDFSQLKKDLSKSRLKMSQQLTGLLQRTLETIKSASFEEMDVVLSTKIGVQGEEVSFYILQNEVQQIINSCAESNRSSLEFAWSKMKTKFEKEDSMFRDLTEKGIGSLKNVTNKTVLGARNLFFKNFKFKPWGATKVANGIGKAAVGLQVLMTAWDFYGRYKRNKQLKEAQKFLSDKVNDYFSEIFKMVNDDSSYYQNFAPVYFEMCEELESRKKQCDEIDNQEARLSSFRTKIHDIEDAIIVE